MKLTQEKADTLMMVLSEIKERIKGIKSNLEMTTSAIRERIVTAQTITNLGAVEGTQEILVPIGSGCFISATVKKVETVLVGIGADITLAKKRDDAIQILNNHINEFEKARASLAASLDELTKKYHEIETQLSQMYQGAR